MIANMDPLPTAAQYIAAAHRKHDRYYKLPREIECFVDRANQELPRGYRMEPHTLNQSVTLFADNGDCVAQMTYGFIETQLVMALDYLKVLIHNYEEST